MSEFNPLEDIGKNIEDLIDTGFPSSVFQVNLDAASTGKGPSVSTEFTARRTKSLVSPLEFLGVVRPKIALGNGRLTLAGELDTNNKAGVSAEVADLLVPNSTLEFALSQSIDIREKVSQTEVEADWSFSTDLLALKVGASCDLEDWKDTASARATIVLQQKPWKNLYWSLSGETLRYEEERRKLIGYAADAKVAYKTEQSEAILNVQYASDEDKITIGTSWFQRLSERLNYGVQFATSVQPEGGFKTKAVVVGELKVDDDTTLRAKTTTSAGENKPANIRFGLGATQRFTFGTATLGADLNGRHFFNASSTNRDEGHSLGFEVSFS